MSDSTTKPCTVCKQILPATIEYFHPNKACRDGLHTQCRECRNARRRKAWAENADEINARRRAEYGGEKQRRNIEYHRRWRKEHEDIYRAGKRKWYQENREHDLAKSREWREKNAEYKKQYDSEYAKRNYAKVHEKKSNWASNNRRRINKLRREKYAQNPIDRRLSNVRREARKRMLPDTFTKSDYDFMLAYWNGKCAVCGSGKKLQMDHWTPLFDESCHGTVPDNIVPLCRSCNASKQHRYPKEWLEWKYPEIANKILARIERYFETVS